MSISAPTKCKAFSSPKVHYQAYTHLQICWIDVILDDRLHFDKTFALSFTEDTFKGDYSNELGNFSADFDFVLRVATITTLLLTKRCWYFSYHQWLWSSLID